MQICLANPSEAGWGEARTWAMLAALILLGLLPARAVADGLEGTNPNAFLRRGQPTFVVGTSGDDRCDREIRRQAELIRDLLFPDSSIVADGAIDVGRGPEAWPPNPVLYGGPQANAILAKLGPTLPFRVGREASTSAVGRSGGRNTA